MEQVQASSAELGATECGRDDVLLTLLGDVARNYIELRGAQRELAIIRSRLPDIAETLARKVVAAVQALRKLELKKPPSISETLDWVKALTLLNATTLDGALVARTLSVILKYEADIAKAQSHANFIANAELKS